jgi:hypothetical protein
MILQPFAILVRVGVDEPGDDTFAAEVDDSGLRANEWLHLN